MHNRLSTILALLGAAFAIGAARLAASATPPPPTLTAAQSKAVLAAAQGYRSWKNALVNPEPDRSPVDCKAPNPFVPPSPSLAKTGDDGHGKKLYYLYAKDLHAYRVGTGLHGDWSTLFPGVAPKPDREDTPALKRREQEVGQAIVKESWSDRPVLDSAPQRPTPEGMDKLIRTRTWVDGATHEIGERGALFVMAKVGAPGTPQTDEGWVYATLTPDGKSITSGGLLPTCMGCHTKAKHDRLFGPKEAW